MLRGGMRASLEIDYNAGKMKAGDTHREPRRLRSRSTAPRARLSSGAVPTVDPDNVVVLHQVHVVGGQGAHAWRFAPTPTRPTTRRSRASFGAEGIGLCRTEHMFFGPERIDAVREMIMAQNAKERAKALAKILPMQRDDFVGILREMQGLPVTIRLLDPPLHEFLPKEERRDPRARAENRDARRSI